MQAIILAGGFGTRLQSVTNGMPKPMAPIEGRPFLSWLLEYMKGQGITEAMLCLHHLHHSIQAHFGPHFRGMRLRYCIEKSPLGTGGAIASALGLLKPVHPVLVMNGDSLVQLDYRRMRQAHIASGKRLTLATLRVGDCSRYGQLAIENGEIMRFDTVGQAGRGDISAGFYVASPNLFDGFNLPRAFSFERDFLAPQAPRLRPAAYNKVEYFIDIGIPRDYALAQQVIPERLGTKQAA